MVNTQSANKEEINDAALLLPTKTKEMDMMGVRDNPKQLPRTVDIIGYFLFR